MGIRCTAEGRLAEGLPSLVGVAYHEVGNLLLAIRTAAWLMMRETGAAGKAQERFDTVEEGCRRAETLLRRCLEQACAPVGSPQAPTPGIVELASLIRREAHLQFTTWRARKNLRLRLRLQTVHVLGVPDDLCALVSNLLDNAFKYSPPESRITVHLERRGQEIRLRVLDEAPPVQEELAARMFRPFQRGTTAVEGTGLGLWIVRRVVQAHGGVAGVRKRKARGNCFWVRMPVADGPADPPGPPRRASRNAPEPPGAAHEIRAPGRGFRGER